MNTVIKRSLIMILMVMMVVAFVPNLGSFSMAYAEDGPEEEAAVQETEEAVVPAEDTAQEEVPVSEEQAVTETDEETETESEMQSVTESESAETPESINIDSDITIKEIIKSPSLKSVSYDTENNIMSVSDGVYSISGLVDQGLKNDDILEVRGSVTLNVDIDFDIDRIIPGTGTNSLNITGERTLTVANGINLSTYGSFCMTSGSLRINGPYPSGNPSSAIYASTANIEGGRIDIMFDDTEKPNQCGFEVDWFTMNGGEINIDISGTGSGYTSGIYCTGDTSYLVINGGTLNIDVENSFGYPYGIFNHNSSGGYVVDIKGGTTTVRANRTYDGNYADARGITGNGLDFYLRDGSLTVDVTNAGEDTYGITGKYFNISGGTLDIISVTSKEGENGYGIKTDEDASFIMSGGNVTLKGRTYSMSSGEGIGLYYTNSDASRRIDISGGTLTVTGDTHGIYVYNNTGNELSVQNQIYGTAKVTADSYQEGIYGVRDAGWDVFGEAELTATSNERYGLYTNGPLLFGDTCVGVMETRGSWTRGVYADGGITIADTLEIANPSGGKVSADKKTIVDSSDTNAQKIGIQPKDVVKANVLFFDESTGQKITNPSLMVYKNDGPWQAGGEDPVRFSVGKGEPFTLTAGISTSGEYGTTYNDYEFVGWYKNIYPGTSPIGTNTTTPSQSITSDTWYYAVFAPPKTEIKSLTFTTDKTPVPGMTRSDIPTATVEEEGIYITGTAWLDMDGKHLAEDYIFTSGDSVKLKIDYSVDKAYKLSGDIESYTTVNGKNTYMVNDVNETAVYINYTVPNLITTVDIGNIFTQLDPVNVVPFTTEIHDEPDSDGINFNDKMEILSERWTSGGEDPIETPDSGLAVLGKSYTYNVVIGVKDGWIFGDSFKFIVGGSEVTTHSAIISEDHKSVWLTGFEYATVKPAAFKDATVTLSTSSYTYNGKVKTPTVTVKYNGDKLVKNTDYTVSLPSGRKNVGSYKITIKGKGNFTGSVTKTFKINPMGTTLKSLTAYKKALTVKWTKRSTKMSTSRISGYQIQFATDSKFTKNVKTVTVSGYSKVSKKVTGLKAKTKYYVRIRTYKTVSGTKYYSTWSSYKYKKTK